MGRFEWLLIGSMFVIGVIAGLMIGAPSVLWLGRPAGALPPPGGDQQTAAAETKNLAVAVVQTQTTTSSERMTQAFQRYCIDADPERARAELTARLGRPAPGDVTRLRSRDAVHMWTHQTWTEQGDPNDRLIFGMSQIDGVPQTCAVTSTWGEKSEIINKLSASVALADATAWIEHGTEVTRWKARARGVVVQIKLDIPTYNDEPGRTLTLFRDGAKIVSKGKLQRNYTLDDLETPQRTDGDDSMPKAGQRGLR